MRVGISALIASVYNVTRAGHARAPLLCNTLRLRVTVAAAPLARSRLHALARNTSYRMPPLLRLAVALLRL